MNVPTDVRRALWTLATAARNAAVMLSILALMCEARVWHVRGRAER
jgi:hypothetical protein